MAKEEVVKHTRLAHEDKIDDIIFDLYANPPGLFDPKKVINKRLVYFNIIGKSA